MPVLDLDDQVRSTVHRAPQSAQYYRGKDLDDAARCSAFHGNLRHFFESFDYPGLENVNSYIENTSSSFNVLLEVVRHQPTREIFAAAFNAAISDFRFGTRRVVFTGVCTVVSEQEEKELTYLPHLAIYAQEDKFSPVQEAADITESMSFYFDWRRKIFIEQPNRWFVPVLLVDHSHAVLCLFHRSGAHVMKTVKIHEDRPAFLKLILCLASPYDDLKIGIPPDIYFDGHARFLEHHDKETGETLRYEMEDPRPVYLLQNIVSRGSCCWLVRGEADPNALYIVKEAWRHSERHSEADFLEAAKGLPGVSQMVWSLDMATISAFPGVPSNELRRKGEDRIFSRTLLWDHGDSLGTYSSFLDLLKGFYDAIVGHRELLLKKKILHRDVSMGNILLGYSNSRKGYRGVLIDFDLASWVRERLPKVTSSGTRNYQSMRVHYVLSLEEKTPEPAHSHLDDLESFFWVLLDAIYRWSSNPGELEEVLPWMHRDYKYSRTGMLEKKKGVMLKAATSELRAPTLRPNSAPVMELIVNLSVHFLDKFEYEIGPTVITPVDQFLEACVDDYDYVLLCFKIAIKKLAEPEPSHPSSTCPLNAVSPVSKLTRRDSIVSPIHRSPLANINKDVGLSQNDEQTPPGEDLKKVGSPANKRARASTIAAGATSLSPKYIKKGMKRRASGGSENAFEPLDEAAAKRRRT